MTRILLVEDEPELARALVGRLGGESYVVDHVSHLGGAIEAVMMTAYRAVIVDRRLPDGDGLSLLAVLRTRKPVPPSIVITAMDDVPDRVAGLDAGAADYLVKPFAFEELAARMRGLLRRATPGAGGQPGIRVSALAYDPSVRQVSVAGRTLVVPRRELAILDMLLRSAGKVVLREVLTETTYGFDDEVGPNALEAQVSRLRRRLSDASANVVIEGIRGVGYILRAA